MLVFSLGSAVGTKDVKISLAVVNVYNLADVRLCTRNIRICLKLQVFRIRICVNCHSAFSYSVSFGLYALEDREERYLTEYFLYSWGHSLVLLAVGNAFFFVTHFKEGYGTLVKMR